MHASQEDPINKAKEDKNRITNNKASTLVNTHLLGCRVVTFMLHSSRTRDLFVPYLNDFIRKSFKYNPKKRVMFYGNPCQERRKLYNVGAIRSGDSSFPSVKL